MRILLATSLLLFVISSTKAEVSPLECTPTPERLRGFTFCHFGNQSSADRDTTKVKIQKATFQGQVINNRHITAVLVSFSKFDHIPSSIFSQFEFGDVTRLKITHSKIKNIDKEDFANAVHLRVLEIEDSKIGTVSSKAFALLKNLEEVKIENCSIEYFSDDSFDGLDKLDTINITNNTYVFSRSSG